MYSRSSFNRLPSTLSLRNREQVLRAAYDEQIAGQRGSCQNRLANRILREQFVLRSGLHHVDVAVLARDVQLAGGGYGRSDERSAASYALFVDAGPGLRVIRRHHAVVVYQVEFVAVDDRRGKVDAAGRLAPRDGIARILAVLQREVAVRTLLDRVDRPDRWVARRDKDQAVARDRCGTGDLRVGTQRP